MSNTLYPNTFQHHNAYVDKIAYFLTGNEEKVLNRILREIMGWEKGRSTLETTVSISVLVDGKFRDGERLAYGCGLKDGAVRKALAALVDYGIIKRVGLPDVDGQTYALNLEWDSINWDKMEARRAAREQGFAAKISAARQNNPLLLNSTPPVEQEAPPPVEQEAPPPVEQETKKPMSKLSKPISCAPRREREASSATTQPSEKKERAQDIPAAVAYHEITHRWPPRAAWPELRAINGNGPLWAQVVKAYVMQGWNPANIAGMLEFYARGEVPGRPGAAVMAPADPETYVNVDDFFGGG